MNWRETEMLRMAPSFWPEQWEEWSCHFLRTIFLMFLFCFEREREREGGSASRGGAEREREGENSK